MCSPSPFSTTCSREVEEDYIIIKRLSEGKFSEVKQVQQKRSKKHFALKQVNLSKDPCCDLKIQLLRRVQHKNIIRIYNVFWAAGVMDILLELCIDNMTAYIESRRSGETYQTPAVMEVADSLAQLLRAVNFLHEKQVAHRNIQPRNVLLSSQKIWKLADFTFACEFDSSSHMSEKVGSRPYVAPEVAQREYTEKCDIYSMGVLFIALVRGSEYFRPVSLEDVKGKEAAQELLNADTWTHRVGYGALVLAQHMIAVEDARCNAEEALNNPWLTQSLSVPKESCVIS